MGITKRCWILRVLVLTVAACGSVEPAADPMDPMDPMAPLPGEPQPGDDAGTPPQPMDDAGGETPTADAPPAVPLPSVGIATANVQVSEFALDAQLAVTSTPIAITIVRTGADLTAPATVTLTAAQASTAIGQIHFTAPGSTLTTTGNVTLDLPAQPAGVTSQQVTVTLYSRYNREPRGTTKQLLLDLTAVSGAAALPAPAPRVAITFVGAGDRAYGGVEIPEQVPVGAYGTAPEQCEGWGPGGLRPASPGAGGHPPCGSYRIPLGAQLTHPHYARCNAGMRNDVTPAGSGLVSVTNSVLGVKMFVEEDLRRGNTHLGGNSMTFSQDGNDAFIIKFRTGGAGDYDPIAGMTPGAIGEMSLAFAPHTSQGREAVRFAAISTSPCDFDYAQEAATNPCYRTLTTFSAMQVEILPTGTSTTGKCTLRPNTTYYLSMRWEDPRAPGYISCRPAAGSPYGNYCGTVLNIN